jgi:hypothetical protein
VRFWLLAEPIGESSEPVWKIYSDDAILAEYWETWMTKGIAYNKANGHEEGAGINPLRCIDDWIVVNWAVPATPESLLQILSAPKPQLI